MYGDNLFLLVLLARQKDPKFLVAVLIVHLGFRV